MDNDIILYLIKKLVDDIIGSDDIIRFFLIPGDKGADCLVYHLPGSCDHWLQMSGITFQLLVIHLLNQLCDIRGVVSNAFDIRNDLQNRRNRAQILCDGLLGCNEHQALSFDAALQVVDIAVIGHDPLCQLHIFVFDGKK